MTAIFPLSECFLVQKSLFKNVSIKLFEIKSNNEIFKLMKINKDIIFIEKDLKALKSDVLKYEC